MDDKTLARKVISVLGYAYDADALTDSEVDELERWLIVKFDLDEGLLP